MHKRASTILAFTVAGTCTGMTWAGGCQDWRAGPFTNTVPNGTQGMGGGPTEDVEAMIEWDPDGAGPEPLMLVIGGSFDSIEGVPALNLAMRNSVTGQWQELGGGVLGRPQSLAIYNGDLIVAGSGNMGVAGGNGIARWDGSSWHSMGGGVSTSNVWAVTVYAGQLIAGGTFTSAGGQPANYIARWNGATWQPLGSGVNAPAVWGLTVYGGQLIACGDFTLAGGQPANHIARWNGATWQALGGGITGGNEHVHRVAVYAGQLIAGGQFTTAGGQSANNIARWNGSVWQALGSGIGGGVYALTIDNGGLIAGGPFSFAGGLPANHVARWNGASWQALGSGVAGGNEVVRSLAFHNDEVIAGGGFDTADGQAANNIARWNGQFWYPFGGGSVDAVSAITTYGSRLIVGGEFLQPAVSGGPVRNIASWDGQHASPMNTGMNAPVHALKSFTYPGPFGERELIAGGAFTSAGGATSLRIARWTESPIIVFPPPPPNNWQAMGPGFNSTVTAIERFNNETYAGGAFTASGATSVNRIARWNETTDTWQPLGTGANSTVYAMKAFNGQLYIGGAFTTVNLIPTGGLARWNGTTWSSVGGNFNGIVYALEVHNGMLLIGGLFPGINNSPNIAGFNGTSYSTFGTGGTNAAVRSLKSTSLGFYIGGEFTAAGGISAGRIARWNGGAWQQVDGGVDHRVSALGGFHDEVHAGGWFEYIDGGSVLSPRWGKYHETGVPWIVDQPDSATRPCHANFAPNVEVASGYGGLNNAQWRRNGVPLTNGPTGTGSSIVGAFGNFAVQNVSDADEGAYDCVISNACGSVTTALAMLTVTDPCPACFGDIVTTGASAGVINIDDLLAVISAWGACPAFPGNCGADISPLGPPPDQPLGDGVVNIDDLLMVISGWGACP